MDDQNKSMNDRWDRGVVPERGYAADVEPGTERDDRAATDRRTREIRSEIEQTREDMSETIDAIQNRLRPSSIVSNAKDTVREATVGKVKQMATSARRRLAGDAGDFSSGEYGVMDRIRENPIPVAIAAASIAWIAFSGRSRRRVSPAIYGSTRQGEPYLRETVISEDIDEATEVGGYSTGDAAERARSMVRETGTTVRRATSTAQTRLQRFVSDNPLAAGAVAAAVGATVGLALPETRRENELMGETRDTVVNRAQDAARGVAERVQDAAERVSSIAGETARSVRPEQQ